MTQRTFTAAEYEKRAVQLDDAAACSVGARIQSLRSDAAMLRQGAEALERWAQLKAWAAKCDPYYYAHLLATLARLEGDEATAVKLEVGAMSYTDRVLALRKPEVRAALGMAPLSDSPARLEGKRP